MVERANLLKGRWRSKCICHDVRPLPPLNYCSIAQGIRRTSAMLRVLAFPTGYPRDFTQDHALWYHRYPGDMWAAECYVSVLGECSWCRVYLGCRRPALAHDPPQAMEVDAGEAASDSAGEGPRAAPTAVAHAFWCIRERVGGLLALRGRSAAVWHRVQEQHDWE